MEGHHLLGSPCSEGKHLFLLPSLISTSIWHILRLSVLTKVLGKSQQCRGKDISLLCAAPSSFSSFLLPGPAQRGRHHEEWKEEGELSRLGKKNGLRRHSEHMWRGQAEKDYRTDKLIMNPETALTAVPCMTSLGD